MKFTVKGLQRLKGMGYINLVVPVPLSEEEEINKIDPEKQYVVEVKQWRKGRSNDANKYAWVLCQKIAEKLSEESFHSKEDVYRKAIRECGSKEPRMGAIQKIADHFGLKKSNLIEDNGLTEKQGYYIDPEAAKMAQELYENPGMRILFDAAKNVSPEDLKVAAELISRMKKKEEYEE